MNRTKPGLARIFALATMALATDAYSMTENERAVETVKVQELLGRSAVSYDKKDFEGWLATFTPDAEWVTQYERCKGTEALRAYGAKGMTCKGVPGYTAQPNAPPRRASSTPPPAQAAGGPAAGTAPPAGGGGGASHFVSAGSVTFTDDHTANYRANWMTVVSGDTGGRIVSAGHYDDTIVKVNGRWLIKQRQLLH